MTNLKVADGFELPIGAVVQKMAILARSGAGKTNTAVDIVEELLAAGQQVVILDPPGAWWGLRSSADGKKAGYPVVVAGGPHQDLPLDPGAGALWADLVVDHTLSAVLDLSDFTDGEIAKFVAKFAERLYARKNTERTPMLLVLEEADELAPQNLPKTEAGGQALMLHHVERIAKRGRGRGIGMLAITQRSASLNKHVLSQIEVLIAMQTTAPQDIAAIREWVRDPSHHDAAREQQLMSEINSLPVGTGYVWSPSWLQVFQRVSFRKRRTFDSSATPEPGEVRAQPKKLADVDLAGLRDKLAASIEKAKAEDPAELRRQIADLQRQLAAKPAAALAPVEKIVEVVPSALVAVLRGQARELDKISVDLAAYAHNFREIAERLPGAEATPRPEERTRTPVRRIPPLPERPAPAPPIPASTPPPPNGEVTAPQRRILDALASLAAVGLTEAHRATVAAMAKYRQGGHFNNTLGSLRTQGLVSYPRAEHVELTDEGHGAVRAPFAISSVADLHDAWLGLLDNPQRRILSVLIESYPESVSREELAERAGFSGGGHFNNTLGSLRTMGAAAYPSAGRVVATELLFPNLTSTP